MGTKWEYYVTTLDNDEYRKKNTDNEQVMRWLTTNGNQGWELVAVDRNPDDGSQRQYFKRKKSIFSTYRSIPY